MLSSAALIALSEPFVKISDLLSREDGPAFRELTKIRPVPSHALAP